MRSTALVHARRTSLFLAASLLATLACGSSSSSLPGQGPSGPGGGTPTSATASGAASNDAAVAEAHRRADAATVSLITRFWSQSAGSFAAGYPQAGDATQYWTLAQAIDAVLDGIQRTGGEKYAGFFRTFYLAQDARGWSRDFFDDENWMALVLIRAYDLTGETAYRDQAATLLADIRANATDGACCGAQPGGLWWDRAHTQKATASNAGPVITAARLYERTGDASWLAFAEQVYGYWLANMVDPTTSQVADHVTASGEKVWWRFTYNEGAMIGASLALHRVTGKADYLRAARAIASSMLAGETTATAAGDVLYDGASCNGDCEQFKGIGHRYLSELAAIDPTHPEVATLLHADTTAIWELDRDSQLDTFGVNWAGPATSGTSLQSQSSATMALNLTARSSGAYTAAAPSTADVYEAEDAVLHGLGFEATNAGFGGWGYVAGWQQDGQWVDFTVTVPYATSYVVELRYAAGAGDASRMLFVNGAPAAPNVTFAATGGWAAYGAQDVTIQLPAGASTVSVIFDSSRGSHGALNLDSIAVRPAPTCGDPLPAPPVPVSSAAPTCGGRQLCWSASAGATSYDLVVDGAVRCSTSSTCCDPGPLADGDHRWYVVARAACGASSGPAAHVETGSALGALQLAAAPGGGRVDWTPLKGATAYDAYLDGELVCAGITTTSCDAGAVPQGTHTWKVVARSDCDRVDATLTAP